MLVGKKRGVQRTFIEVGVYMGMKDDDYDEKQTSAHRGPCLSKEGHHSIDDAFSLAYTSRSSILALDFYYGSFEFSIKGQDIKSKPITNQGQTVTHF